MISLRTWHRPASLLLSIHWAFPQNSITAAAGTTGHSRHPGRTASLGAVTGVALDASGNIYLAAAGNNLVFRLSSDGFLTVIAGNGLQGLTGDGGAATSASLNHPAGLAFDSTGNLYVADYGNNWILGKA